MEKKRNRLLFVGFLIALALLVAVAALWWFSPTQRQHRRNQSLIAASMAGDAKAVQYELAEGADANARDEIGITALMYAARGNRPNMSDPPATDHPEVVQILLKNGAEVNAATADGFLALFWAARYGHGNVAKVLIDHGADVNAKHKVDGMTAMKWANTNRAASPANYEKIIALLKEAGANE